MPVIDTPVLSARQQEERHNSLVWALRAETDVKSFESVGVARSVGGQNTSDTTKDINVQLTPSL
jgi:hypothetical protein